MSVEKIKRRIIFWVLVVLFSITAIYVVFYARGYIFDFQSGVFVHSGTIIIKSNPQKIDANVNDKLFTAKKLNLMNGAYSISTLVPREYKLTIGSEGFKEWSKKIIVHSGLTTEFWNVLLIKNEYEKKAYDSSGIRKFYISPKSKRLIFVQDSSNGFSAKLLNVENNSVENNFIFDGWNFIEDSRKENIEWSPEDDYLSVPVQKKSGNEEEYAYFILNPKNNTQFNLNDFLGMKNISHVRWDPKNREYLFFLNENSLYKANIEVKNDITLIAKNALNFDLSKTNVFFLQAPNQLVFKSSLDGQTDKAQITETFPESSTQESNLMVVYDETRVAFLNNNKELFVFNSGFEDKYFYKLSGDVEGIQFSDDGKKLLYWTKNEISVYFLRDWGVQPLRNENEIQNITRYSEEIKNVQWFNFDYEHVIFSIGPEVKIIELDPRDHRNSTDLIKTNSANPFLTYNDTLEKLLFIDEKDSFNNLFSIDFPEKTNILGL